MNPSGKVQFVFVDIHGNLLVPFIFMNPNDIPMQNRKVEEYIARVFDFAQMFLASCGVVLLFHLNDFRLLKEIKFYLESYGF
jgi:hypothetical protein